MGQSRKVCENYRYNYEENTILIFKVCCFLTVVFACMLCYYHAQPAIEFVHQKETEYNALHWRAVDAKIVQLGPARGDMQPNIQTVTIEYPQSETQKRTNIDVQLGYHEGDLVAMYVNDNGENVVHTKYVSDKTKFDSTSPFMAAFLSWQAFWELIGLCLAFLLVSFMSGWLLLKEYYLRKTDRLDKRYGLAS